MKIRFINILLDPLAVEGGGTAAAQQPAQAPVQQEQGVSQQGADRGISFNPNDDAERQGLPAEQGRAGSSGAGGSSGVAGLGGVASAPGAGGEGDWESVQDVARGLGYDFNGQQFGDDRQFLLHLLNTAQQNRQADYYAQLGRQIAPHYQGVQNYLQQQQGQGQGQGRQPQQQQRPEWEPPEFNEQWLSLVERDPQTGVFLARQGVDPAIASKVNEYDRWYQQVGRNPVAVMRPYVEQQLPNMVREAMQAEMQSYRQQQEIEGIVSRNAEWMYQNDQSGRPVIGVGGRPVATPEGVRYSQIVGELEQSGMRSPGAVDRLARQILMGEMAQQQLRGSQQQAPAQQQRMALASSRSQQNVLQSLTPQQRQQTPNATDPDMAGLSLAEQMRIALDQGGFTDSDFSPEAFMR